MKSKFKQFIFFIFSPLLVKRAVAIIKERNNKRYGLSEEISFAFSSLLRIKKIELNIKPLQVESEIFSLINKIRKRKPRIVCEIGTASGGVLYLLTRFSSPSATIISIDLPQGKFGGGYPGWKIPIYSSFTQNNQKMHLIRSDSHKSETLEKLKSILSDKKIDFLFIDGDHTYEGVKKDFEMYKALVQEGGIIAFHDIVYGPEKNTGGVPIFWQEIKKDFSYEEIVNDWNQGGYGIGIIYN